MIREYLDKIIEKGSIEDMKCLGHIVIKAMDSLKENDNELYEEIKTKMYEMAYGKVLTKEMAEKWVNSMKPIARWSMEETNSVKNEYGADIDEISFYVVMNMMYSDYKNVFEDDIDKYYRMTMDFLKDEDAGDNKLYKYWKYIVNNRV